MKKNTLLIIFLLLGMIIRVSAQVGINNNNPKAKLDVAAVDQANPSNTDGLLIPRIDKFPATDPTNDQIGMFVYLTTLDGTDVPGFYYWDGTSWICMTCATGSGAHYVGEFFGGGIVFYVDEDRQHGLIASLDNLGPEKWGHSGTTVGSDSAWDGDGNTALIGGSGATAAKLCLNYSHGGFSDWYLPAMWELNQLYNNAFILNEKLSASGDDLLKHDYPTYYWSSTEHNNNSNAYAFDFVEGSTVYKAKTNSYNVRAVRRF